MPAPRHGTLARVRGLLLDVEPLRRDHDFRLLWIGQMVSGAGRQVTVLALPYEVYILTGTPLSIGILALVQMVPILAFSLGGGAIADTVDRRRLLLVTQCVLALTSVALLALALLPHPPVAAFYAVAFVAAGVGAFDQPARSSATPRLVPRERLEAAIGLGQLSFQVVGIAGPLLGGAILAASGGSAAPAFAFDALTFVAAIVAVILIAPIRPHPAAGRPTLRSIAEGLRFARSKRIVLSTFVVDLDAMIFGMPTALFTPLALGVFHAGPAGIGLLTAAPAAGALVGAALTGWTSSVVRPGRAVVVAVAGWGVAITAFGVLAGSFPLALLCLALAGAADVISAVLRNAIVQVETPDELRGRAMSIHALVVTSGPRLGDAEAAGVAALVGPQLSVISGGALCLVGLAIVVRAFPELLAYRMPRGPTVDAPVDTAPAPIDPASGGLDPRAAALDRPGKR